MRGESKHDGLEQDIPVEDAMMEEAAVAGDGIKKVAGQLEVGMESRDRNTMECM